ncbi:MAG: sigma-70 family RNA polymerase sigma factor [Planctomycetota bacterium]
MAHAPSASGPPGASRFLTTRWSLVLAAGSTDPVAALDELCATYWRPVLRFVEHSGYGTEDARDLTQGFFAAFLERRDVEGLDPARGRFRSYLLAAVRNFLANEREREGTLKRGGGVRVRSLRSPQAEDEAGLLPADARTPEAEFERQWALAVLRRALERLRVEQESKGRGALFEQLKPALSGGAPEGGHAAVAAELGQTAVAVKVAAHRLRRRYGELLLEEVARTVDTPQEIEDELAELHRALEA